jgi:hypothetical protein
VCSWKCYVRYFRARSDGGRCWAAVVKVKVSFFSARRSSREGSCFYQSAFFVGVRVLPPGMVKGRATNSSLKRRFDGILLGLAFIFGGVGGL